jgi:Holliday junction resolvase RusA-like endonuclease
MPQLALTSPPERSLTFRVNGVPVPQGSKVPRVIGQRVRLRNGLVAIVGARAVMTEQSDMKGKTLARGRLSAWRARVTSAARVAWYEAYGLNDPWSCALELAIAFELPRPPSHWLRPGALKRSAPRAPTSKPDLSKLIRAVEDALTGVVYDDDARIVQYAAPRKRFALYGATGGVSVVVRCLRADELEGA